MSFLDTLRASDQKLEAWLDAVGADTVAERAERQKVLDAQTAIRRQIREIELKDLQAAGAAVAAHTAELTALNEQIEATTKSIQAVQQVLTVAASIVAVGAQVVTIVAAL